MAATISVSGGEKYESCLEVSWEVLPASQRFREFTVEMTLDRRSAATVAASSDGPLQPPPDCVVKTVSAKGAEREASLKNMPVGRSFLVAVVGQTASGEELRSPWIRLSTLPALEPQEYEELGHEDPFTKPRMQCKECRCPCYVPSCWRDDQTKVRDMRCRRCGCSYKFHELLDIAKVLAKKEEQGRQLLKRAEVTGLPDEALEWSERECMLWFCTEGAVHPRKADVRASSRQLTGSKKNRVSVVCPTTESRQRFHRLLWKCFDAQTWPDKELVVVETYAHSASKFFKRMAKQDSRIVFASYQVPADKDWSIGTKRNLCTHLATGEFLANFDDDDLYAPNYLKTMITHLSSSPKAKLATLSSWYIFKTESREWGFVDPITWGRTKGLSEEDKQVKEWAYGYGFSYVLKRSASLEAWYEDLNFGEDFAFLSALKNKVVIRRDDFGICLHVLHGANTSDSLPLRSVEADEAARLEIMDLPHKFFLAEGVDGEAAGPRVPLAPRERSWRVLAHVRERDLPIMCKGRHTAADFLSLLQLPFNRRNPALAAVPPWSALSCWRLYRVPPEGVESDAAREEIAAHVLGIQHLREDADPVHFKVMLTEAMAQVTDLETLGVRVTRFWLQPPEVSSQELPAEISNLNLNEEFITVQCTCGEASTSATNFTLKAFEARVMSYWGSDVAALRATLDWSLPSNAAVIEELPGGQSLALADEDPLPTKVMVEEFRGRVPFYLKFSRDQALFFLQHVVDFVKRPGFEARLNKLMEESTTFRAYNGLVGKVLMSEIYPAVAKRLNLPLEHCVSSDFFGTALSGVARRDRLVNQLEIEVTVALRTWPAARAGVDWMNAQRRAAGEEPLFLEKFPFVHWPPEQFMEFCDRRCNLAKALAEAPREPPPARGG